MHRLRILHISDLHERVELAWMDEERKQQIRNGAAGRNRVLEESNFHETIRKLRESGRIDFVCFTGDIADWGLEEEYSLATERVDAILAASGVGRDRLFLVPGNHDVQRKKHEEIWKKIRNLAMQRPDECSSWMAGQSTLHGADPKWRDAINDRTRAFWAWVECELGRPDLCPWRGPHGRLGYRASLPLDLPFPIHIIGLDSAWLAGDENDARKLRITDLQIDRLARDDLGRRLGGFRIALVHHPLSDLDDERSAIQRLSETVNLVLHGHQHDPLTEVRMDPDRSLQVLAAGSLYEGDEGDRWINGFQAIDAELDDEGRPLRYEVRFWAWAKAGHWYPSGAIYRSAPNGVLSIELSGAPASEPPLPGPKRYFLPQPDLGAHTGVVHYESGKEEDLNLDYERNGSLAPITVNRIGDYQQRRKQYIDHLLEVSSIDVCLRHCHWYRQHEFLTHPLEVSGQDISYLYQLAKYSFHQTICRFGVDEKGVRHFDPTDDKDDDPILDVIVRNKSDDTIITKRLFIAPLAAWTIGKGYPMPGIIKPMTAYTIQVDFLRKFSIFTFDHPLCIPAKGLWRFYLYLESFSKSLCEFGNESLITIGIEENNSICESEPIYLGIN